MLAASPLRVIRMRPPEAVAAAADGAARAGARQRAPQRPPVTHFVGLRLTSPAVSTAVERVHAAVLAHDAGFASALVPASSAHVTLCVLRLPDDDSVAAAAAALARVGAPAVRPRLRGVSAFGGAVLYLDLADDGERAAVCALQASVLDALQAAGLPVERERGAYTPHVTVAKMSKATVACKSRLRALPPPHALALPEEDVAETCADELLLCAMRAPKAADGFYSVVGAVPLRGADAA